MKNIMSGLFCILAFQAKLSAQVVNIDDAGNGSLSIKIDTKTFKGPDIKYKAIPLGKVNLTNSIFMERYQLNKKYMLSLESDKLLQNFYYEAGMSKTGHSMLGKEKNYEDFYWGWDSPSSQLRGHFLGHWLSAAAYMYATTGDLEIKAKADYIVGELAECQLHNGGQWAGSIPEKYFELLATGKPVWSPQYTIHKTLMGLYDMYAVTGSRQALDVLDKFADWFDQWTASQTAHNNAGVIYGGETSGMLEVWANMYKATGKEKYITLMQRYGNPGLFQDLLSGKDALSNDHANASIPWSHGAARAYEVTGNNHWRDITTAFWKNAVLDRESFCTGGQNAGEFWIPPHKIDQFLTQNNQEHCTVYNMNRTADYLLRWTGDTRYGDYIEKNLYNGILAQQNPHTGMVAYFLPMAGGYKKGGDKGWGTPTMDFWCCHGSLVQAQTRYAEQIYFENDNALLISQYIPSQLNWVSNGTNVQVQQDFDALQYTKEYAANRWNITLKVKAEKTAEFMIQLRLPGWLRKKAIIKVNGVQQPVNMLSGLYTINRSWKDDIVTIEFPTEVYTEALPNTKNVVAYMEGPVVLAGVTDEDITLRGDIKNPKSILRQEYEQEYKLVRWKQSHYKTINQISNIRLMPLYEIADERYTIYFTIQK